MIFKSDAECGKLVTVIAAVVGQTEITKITSLVVEFIYM